MEIIGNYENTNAPSNITAKSVALLTIETGEITVQTQPNKAFLIGMTIKISNSLNSWMCGVVKSYDIQTGNLVVNVQSKSGIGSYSSWDIYISTPNQGAMQEAVVRMNFQGATLTPTLGVARFTPHKAITITNAIISIAETSSSQIKLDIKKNNVSVLSGDYLTLSANTFTSLPTGLNFSLTTTDSLTVDIVAALGGKNLTLSLVYI